MKFSVGKKKKSGVVLLFHVVISSLLSSAEFRRASAAAATAASDTVLVCTSREIDDIGILWPLASHFWRNSVHKLAFYPRALAHEESHLLFHLLLRKSVEVELHKFVSISSQFANGSGTQA